MSLVKGKDLKEIIANGLGVHENHLTFTLRKVLLDFANSLEDKDHYDLFCCLAELMLMADEDAGPVIANLMKATDGELEVMDKNTFSSAGYFLTDYFKKKNVLSYFRKNSKEEDIDGEAESEPVVNRTSYTELLAPEKIPTLHAQKVKTRIERREKLKSLLPQFKTQPELLDLLEYRDLLIVPGLLGYHQKPTTLGSKEDIVMWIKKALAEKSFDGHKDLGDEVK